MKQEKKGNEIHMKQSKTMLEGSEWKLILLFTLPLMAGNLLQQLYNTVDGIVVGNFVGETALAAVGTCAPLTMLFTAIALGMSNGAAVVVSQFYGAGRMNEMKKAVASSLILLFGMGVVLSILGCVLSGWLLRVVLGVQEYLLPQAELYFRIYAIGLLAQFIYNIVAAILRSMGDSRATLYFLLVSAVCNILLDMLAVIALGWGVMGVAVATVVSQILSAAVSVVYLFHRYTSLRFAKGELRFDGEMGMLILKMGIPSTLQQCVVSMGHMAIQRVINHFDITAGYTAATRIESFILIPVQGFFMGMATFTGQNLGGGKLSRISKAVKETVLMSLVVVAAVIGIIYPFAPQLVRIFGVTGDSGDVAVTYLRFVALAFVVFCIYFSINGVLQGSGDVVFTAFNTFSGLVIKVVFVYLVAYLTPVGMAAIWWGNLVSWIYSLVLAALRYRFGPWRSKCVVKNS